MMALEVRRLGLAWTAAAAVLLTLALAAGSLWLGGFNPLSAGAAMMRGAFGSSSAILSITMVRAVPLILTGLAVALAFRAPPETKICFVMNRCLPGKSLLNNHLRAHRDTGREQNLTLWGMPGREVWRGQGYQPWDCILATRCSADKCTIILGGIDTNRWLIDRTDQDWITRLEHSELFEFLEFFHWRGQHCRQSQQELASISIQTEVLIEVWWVVRQQLVVPVASMWNRTATKVQGVTVRIENDFHAGRILE